jgi:glycosyltransferase involved in cell wall biosynthesis
MSRTGAPILALSIVRELSNTHNVVVLALGDGELRSAFREFSSHFASDFGTRNGTKGLEKRLKSLTAQADFEIAIVNSIESAMVVKPLELLGVPTVLLVHEFVSYSSSGMQIVEGLNQASAIVFSTELTRESMVSANLVSDASKMHVFPQGKSWVPSNHVREHHDSRFRKTVRAHFGGRRTKPITVIGAGFVQYRKGVDIFIEAAKNLKGNKNQEFKFAWIGDGFSPLHDRAYSVYLEDQIERSGLAEDFVMWESSADFEWLLSQVDVFCLSSRLDPLPNVAIDAMSNGIPVVCFDKASGIADLLKQNKVLKKLVVPYLDSRELAKSIQYASEKFRRGEPSRQDLKTFCAETFEMSSYVSALRKLLISSSAR